MSELSDYRRMVEKPMIADCERRIALLTDALRAAEAERDALVGERDGLLTTAADSARRIDAWQAQAAEEAEGRRQALRQRDEAREALREALASLRTFCGVGCAQTIERGEAALGDPS